MKSVPSQYGFAAVTLEHVGPLVVIRTSPRVRTKADIRAEPVETGAAVRVEVRWTRVSAGRTGSRVAGCLVRVG